MEVSEQLGVLPRLHDRLPDVVVTQSDLLLAEGTREVGVETYEVEVLECDFDVGLDEGTGVAVEESTEVQVGCLSVGIDDHWRGRHGEDEEYEKRMGTYEDSGRCSCRSLGSSRDHSSSTQ